MVTKKRILEGFRAESRIGDLDRKMTYNARSNSNVKSQSCNPVSEGTTADTTETGVTQTQSAVRSPAFKRDKSVSHKLRQSQPTDKQLCQGPNKQLQKDFDDTNKKLIDKVRYGKGQRRNNLPKIEICLEGIERNDQTKSYRHSKSGQRKHYSHH